MSEGGRNAKGGRRLAVWLLLAAGVMLVIGANWHLVYVAIESQPDCVTHVRQGEGNAARGEFSAARSACTPSAREERATP